MSKMVLLVSSLMLVFLVTGCVRLQPVYNVNNPSVVSGSGSGLSAERVKDAILLGAQAKGWIAEEDGYGHIIATIYVRDHVAAVDITYGENSYSISYKDSKNLLYNGAMIHRNYNKWVKLLANQINKELARS